MICPSCGVPQEDDVDVCFSCGRLITALTQGSILAARYEILTLLGKGGMGVVYKAQDRLLDEPVAIKVLRSELMNTPELARRFRSEIKLARKVTHTNVCRIHEYGEDGPLSYISMALIEGTDLRKLLRQQPEGLPTEEAFEASIQSADGLQAIHAVGIIHRDLKTPNIVRDDQGIVRLMDFGIAKEADHNAGLTATGEVMGTPEYMSPEQCRGDQLDFRSDLYSLGIVVYELFTGRVPFHGETVMSTLLKQLQEPPPFDGPAAVRLPASVVPVLRRALAKLPSERHGSAAELAEALRAARLAAAAPAAVAAPEAPVVVALPLSAAPLPTVLPSTPAPVGEPSGQGAERRRDSRLGISVDLVVARQNADGSFGPDERTLADNIGRRGARVLTADDGAAANDVLRIQEHGGDFETRAAVRHVSVGADGIRRLGVEFLDRQAPDRLLPYVEPKARPRKGTRGTRKTPHTPVQAVPPPRTEERRRDTRLSISFDLILRRTGPSGALLEEERTIADNVGRQGVRVMTTMNTLSPGDVVTVEEVGGPFRTRAVVRNQHVGTDRIRRVGLEFLDRQAPGHLIPSEDRPSRATPRSTPDTAGVRAEPRTSTATATATPPASTPASGRAATPGITAEDIHSALARARARSHFEVLGVPSTASEAEVREAGRRLTKRFHPDAPVAPDASHLKREIEVVFIRVAEAYEVLRDTERRTRHERMLGLTPSASPPPPPKPQQSSDPEVRTTPSGVPVASASDADSDLRLAAHVLKEARALLAQERNWDAVRALEDALVLAPGTKVNQALRVLLAQATGRNPKWQKRAEEILLSVIQENASTPDAHLELGVLYKRAGLKARAAAQFRTVLQLRPSDPLAEAELAGLN